MARARFLSYLFGVALTVVLFASCAPRLDETAPSADPNEQSVGAVLWFQSSAEARALYYQAYRLARYQLLEALRREMVRPPAVVVDIDETLLDNSPHQAKLIKTNQVFPSYWDAWIERSEARALPGAVEFLRFADSLGVAVFYVSNRDARSQQWTTKNLLACGFPQVTPERLLLRTTESSKAQRRQRISDEYTIVLLIGDNCNDFTEAFEGRSVEERSATADRLKEEFGGRFIILPNPYYGDWESAVFGYRRGLSINEKNRLRKEALQAF